MEIELFGFRLPSKRIEFVIDINRRSPRGWRYALRLRRNILPVLPSMLSCTRAWRVRVSTHTYFEVTGTRASGLPGGLLFVGMRREEWRHGLANRRGRRPTRSNGRSGVR